MFWGKENIARNEFSEINCNVSGSVLQGLFNVEASCKEFELVVFENAECVLERLLYMVKATQLLTSTAWSPWPFYFALSATLSALHM